MVGCDGGIVSDILSSLVFWSLIPQREEVTVQSGSDSGQAEGACVVWNQRWHRVC